MIKKKLAVIFPGIGYHKDKPLLYYASKLVQSLGYDVINIEYHDIPQIKKGDTVMMKKAADIPFVQAQEQLQNVSFADYDDVLFIGKSIGTVVMARYLSEHEINVKQIWYTPIEAAFSFSSQNVVAFIGDEDPWSDVEKIKTMAQAQGIKLYTYPHCNHSLECEVVDRNIANLREVMHITECFITEEGDFRKATIQ